VRWLLALLVALAVSGSNARAHELRPGFLEIREQAGEIYDIRFKVPARGDLRLGLTVRLPENCAETGALSTQRAGAAFLESRKVRCAGGMVGRELFVEGLAATFTDVVVRVALADGSVQAARLTPDRPGFTVIGSPDWTSTAWTYFALGVEHILLGVDHLLFVFALLLLVRSPWALVKTITAFTLAHSITLAAATLGWAQAPQAPVEAVIALSIAFVAAEIIHQARGETDLATRAPWIVAFGFGLLHGFGFGGALKEIGLPQNDVPLALLTFNLGVEAGQLAFIAAALSLKWALGRLPALEMPWLRLASAYAIGGIAATWFVQRVFAMI
jgi:hydrogenase/urease accessory protein HupE